MKKILGQITHPWRVALFLFFAAALNYADRAALSSVVPPIRTELGATDVQIGLMGLLFLWTYALCSPLAGNVADRFSRSRIVIWSITGWSLVTVFTGLAWSVHALFFMRVALGVVESFYLPAAAALLSEYHGPATRGKAMGFHIMGLNLGVMLGGGLAGLLAEHFGWRFGFWALGGAGLLLAAVGPLVLNKKPEVTSATKPVVKVAGQAGKAWAYLLRLPSFHITLFSSMVAGVAGWIFLTWLPLFFNENYGMNLAAAGLTGVMLYKAPVFLGISVGGWLSDKFARRDTRNRVMIKALSYLLSGPFLFLMMGNPTFAVVAASLIISSIIRAIGQAGEHAIVCDVVPTQYRSTAVGILNLSGSAAGGLGVFLTGVFKKDLGLSAIFGLSSFLYILAGLVLVLSYYVFVKKDVAKADAHEAAAAA